MKDEYDFSNAKRGAIASNKGKTCITIMLDDAVIEAARERAQSAGTGYQTVINNLLRQALVSQDTYNLAPASKKQAKTLQVLNNGISVSEVEALEQQLIALAGELNRMLVNPLPAKSKSNPVSIEGLELASCESRHAGQIQGKKSLHRCSPSPEQESLPGILAEQDATKAARKKFRFVEVVSIRSM